MRAIFLIAAPLILAAACFGGGDRGPTSTPTPGPTLPPYSAIKFCVDVVELPEDFREFAAQRVGDALGDDSPYGSPIVECPPSRLGTTEVWDDFALAGRPVAAPENFWSQDSGAFVFVVPDTWELGTIHRFVTEEFACVGDECNGLSEGLYLKQSEICDEELLIEALNNLIGAQGDDPFTRHRTSIRPTPLA